MDQMLKEKIGKILSSSKIILFMKGTKKAPLCGFSNHLVQILTNLNVDFKDVNILEDNELREGLKEYSSWPTYPQLYINKELIGGCDIINELFENGELKELFKN